MLLLLEQNVMIYIYIYIYEKFFKAWNWKSYGYDLRMSSLIFFSEFKKKYLFLWAVNSQQRHQRECVLDQGDFFFFFLTTSLPAVVFMIRGRRSRHLRVLTKRQIFNRIHPNWVTLNRQPEGSWWDRRGKGVGKTESLVPGALTSQAITNSANARLQAAQRPHSMPFSATFISQGDD